MGAAISARVSDNNDGGTCVTDRPGLGDIPESCISSLLMNFDPTDICKLAQVNRAFHRASSADFLWESKLPSGYKSLLTQVLGEENLHSMTKKQIYAKLCHPNRFDSDTKVSSIFK